jgi:cytoskeleton protein RodZ
MTDAVATGVGQELAAAREARGLALADVAQQLKFAPRQLEALEQERFDALPGATIARGMVRSYARLLKLDPEPLVERLASRFEVPDSNRLAARYHQPVPFSDGARRSTFVYLGLSAGVLALVGAVAFGWHQERTAALKAPAKPATVAKAAPHEIKRSPVPIQAQPAVAPAAPVIEEKESVVKESVIPAENKVTAAAPGLPAAAPGRHRLVVRTEEEAWIEIRDSADRLLVSSLTPPGSERVVRGRPPYSLVIGNASHVQVLYNDKPVNLAPHPRSGVARLTVP